MKQFSARVKVLTAFAAVVGAITGAAFLVGCGGGSGGNAYAATTSVTASGDGANRIDLVRGDSPTLSYYGSYSIGVRTLQLTNPGQIDFSQLTTPLPSTLPTYDRPIKIEVWYPSDPSATGTNRIAATMRDGTYVTLQGKAIQNAAPLATGESFPLVIVSHGYPGNRHLLSPIAENLASKGYVVVGIDHTDSTYESLISNGFYSTLVNRPLDQMFVLKQITTMSQDSSSFLYGLANPDKTAIIGFSMGGYGTMISAGVGVTQTAVDAYSLLSMHQSGTTTHTDMWDSRIKTAIAFAPYGMKSGYFDSTTVQGIKVPMLFFCGTLDTTVGYSDGVRAIWTAATPVDRTLITFANAGHNIAPMSPPVEAYKYDSTLSMYLTNHYTDPVWDNLRLNNLSTHFITAWLAKYLKSDTTMETYLDGSTWTGFSSAPQSVTLEKLSAGS